jgi:RNA polymerase sigma factor (sigma-70 family)
MERSREGVLRAAPALLGNFHDAEEVAQDVFVVAWRELPSLRDPDRLDAWLYRITRNRCSTYHERWRAWRQDLLPLDGLDWPAASEPDLTLRAGTDAIREAVASLSAPNRLATTLFYLDGYSIQEVAGALEVPEGTVKRRLHDSRSLLKARLPRLAATHQRRKDATMPTLTVRRDELRAALDRVRPVAGTSDTRPLLKSICFDMRGDVLTLAAADGFRLGTVSLTVAGTSRTPAQRIVDVVGVDAVRAALAQAREERVTIGYETDGQLYVTLGGAVHAVTAVAGTFPDVAQIIPEACRTRVSVPAHRLLDATRSASAEAQPPLLLDPIPGNPGQLRLFAPGGREEVCEAVVEGVPQRIALSVPLLLPILDAAGEAQLELCWTEPLKPVRLRTLDELACTWAIQPMAAPVVMEHVFA